MLLSDEDSLCNSPTCADQNTDAKPDEYLVIGEFYPLRKDFSDLGRIGDQVKILKRIQDSPPMYLAEFPGGKVCNIWLDYIECENFDCCLPTTWDSEEWLTRLTKVVIHVGLDYEIKRWNDHYDILVRSGDALLSILLPWAGSIYLNRVIPTHDGAWCLSINLTDIGAEDDLRRQLYLFKMNPESLNADGTVSIEETLSE